MEKTAYPEHLVDIIKNDKRANAREHEAWGKQDVLVDFSFEKTTREDEAVRVLNKVLRRFAHQEHLHFSIIIYGDEQPNNIGCYHFHTYIKVVASEREIDIGKLIKKLERMWWDIQGVASTGREHHKCFLGQAMDTRIANYIARSSKINDVTGFEYRAAHSTHNAVDTLVCPRRKSSCRKNRCEHSTSTKFKSNEKLDRTRSTMRSAGNCNDLSAR